MQRYLVEIFWSDEDEGYIEPLIMIRTLLIVKLFFCFYK